MNSPKLFPENRGKVIYVAVYADFRVRAAEPGNVPSLNIANSVVLYDVCLIRRQIKRQSPRFCEMGVVLSPNNYVGQRPSKRSEI